MSRTFSSLTSAVSLFLCVMWAWSYTAPFCIWVGSTPQPTTDGYRGIVHREFYFGDGCIYLEWAFHESRNSGYLASVSASGSSSSPPPSVDTVLGFGFHSEIWEDSLRRYRLVSAALPLWPFLLQAIKPLYRFVLWARRHSSRSTPPGLCHCCSYNLTGNVSGICPECGTPIKQPVFMRS
jgi:hypothetical protein